ncbi:hypothetical protein CEXT_544331 [Caerostris extrusa]|uniref:Uncharacterized protein n=1 Tax=Caerostris extrusa TaxID=172846 RepID=A0AAV4Q9A8_CAEEX|nr:hypothetical protein CEXT_544331 [Caerostris extrusa]
MRFECCDEWRCDGAERRKARLGSTGNDCSAFWRGVAFLFRGLLKARGEMDERVFELSGLTAPEKVGLG